MKLFYQSMTLQTVKAARAQRDEEPPEKSCTAC